MHLVVLIDTPDPVESDLLEGQVASFTAAGKLATRITSEEAERIWIANTVHRGDLEALVSGSTAIHEQHSAFFLFEDSEMDARNAVPPLIKLASIRARAFEN